MKLLECLVGLALSLMVIGGLLKNSSELLIKQIEYEKMQFVQAPGAGLHTANPPRFINALQSRRHKKYIMASSSLTWKILL